MKEKLRIAVMGAGVIARLNGRALLSIPEAEICAISNHHPEKAAALAAELGIECPVYADWKPMLEREKPDAAAIFLPHYLHLPAFLDCAAAGVDVIIEKALALDWDECRTMMDAAERSGIRATVCHTQRYNAVYIAAKEYMAAHPELGRLLGVVDGINYNYFWQGRSPWQLSQAQSGGGIALNYGVHQLDRVHWLMGDKTAELTIKYLREKPGYEIYSSYAMQGVTLGGVPYSITCAGYSGPFIAGTRLAFENGVLECSLVENGFHPYGLFFGNTETGRFAAQGPLLPNDAHDMYVRQFRAAADYILGRTDEPPVPLSWAAEMVRLAVSGFPEK